MTAQEFFKNDRFATNAGVELIEIKEGYSTVSYTHLTLPTKLEV